MRWLKLGLWPFSLAYKAVTSLRNDLYDKKVYSSASFTVPIIVIGNLSVGGTGKTPHAEFLIRLLGQSNNLAYLSRGYRRRSNGFRFVSPESTAFEIGDEAKQVKLAFPETCVAVSESRVMAIPEILAENSVDAIILDDAFQHRAVQATYSILLSRFDNLYSQDQLLPSGTLRESKEGAKRANTIIVTACPEDLDQVQMDETRKELKPLSNQRLFFSYMSYGKPYLIWERKNIFAAENWDEIIALSAIANPSAFEKKLATFKRPVHSFRFADHHYFNDSDFSKLEKLVEESEQRKKRVCIITTEKDATRLYLHQQFLKEKSWSIYVLPIKVKLIGDQSETILKSDLNACIKASKEQEDI